MWLIPAVQAEAGVPDQPELHSEILFYQEEKANVDREGLTI